MQIFQIIDSEYTEVKEVLLFVVKFSKIRSKKTYAEKCQRNKFKIFKTSRIGADVSFLHSTEIFKTIL